MRFKESPELFGNGCGVSTCGDIKCDLCKTMYNKGNDAIEKYDGDSVTHTNFAGFTICDCCFEKIEREVLYRMPDILEWYREILDSQKKTLTKNEKALEKCERGSR